MNEHLPAPMDTSPDLRPALPPALQALDPLTDPYADVLEVPVLLPGWQVSALERAAHDRGLTAGEMLRQLLANFFLQKAPRLS